MNRERRPAPRGHRSAAHGLRRGAGRLLLAGVAMLVAGLVTQGGPLGPMFAVFAPLGWLAVAAGSALMGLYHWRRQGRAVPPAPPAQRVEPGLRVPPSQPQQAPARTTIPTPIPTPIPEPPESAPDEPAWTLELLREIEWRRFEAVCEALFQHERYRTRSQEYGADGGVDIWLYPLAGSDAVGIVQCKSWSKRVGEVPLRELLGLKTAHKVQTAVLCAAGEFHEAALRFGRANDLVLLDGAELLRRILGCPPETQRSLLAVATQGDYRRPTCVQCGSKMVLRRGADRPAFWGCETYPRCRHILQASADEQEPA